MSDMERLAGKRDFELVQLPAEILERIVGFDDMTRSVIRLWTAGSRTLQHKMRHIPVAMSFESLLAMDFAVLPTILCELRGLRSLTIERSIFPLNNSAHTLAVLQNLSPTLEKLALRFGLAGDFCEPDDALRDTALYDNDLPSVRNTGLATHGKYVDLPSIFPRLQWLDFGSNNFAPLLLPASLTHLECAFSFFSEPTSFVLPPSLTSFTPHSRDVPPKCFWAALPPTLESLDLRSCYQTHYMDLEQVKSLPRSLRSLWFGGRGGFVVTSEIIAVLPPRLESLLNIYANEPHLIDSVSRALPSLTDLHFAAGKVCAPQFRQLSRNLTRLDCNVDSMEGFEKTDFPPRLTDLVAICYDSLPSIGISALLPKHCLRTLGLHADNIKASDINSLPATLTKFHLTTYGPIESDDALISLPPHLQDLLLAANREESLLFAAMPLSLTTAQLEVLIDVSALYALPPFLRKLNLGGAHSSMEFDPKGSKEAERIAFLRTKAEEAGFSADETLPTFRPREYGLFDLLPRTLTDLKIGTDSDLSDLDALDWQSLPKKLKTLDISNIELPENVLDYLPIESISDRLKLPLVTWEEEHFKRLHSKLTTLDCGLDFKELSAASVTALPRGLACHPHPTYVKLEAERFAALNSIDRQRFQRAISRTSSVINHGIM